MIDSMGALIGRHREPQGMWILLERASIKILVLCNEYLVRASERPQNWSQLAKTGEEKRDRMDEEPWPGKSQRGNVPASDPMQENQKSKK